jgi:hypothetical protein
MCWKCEQIDKHIEHYRGLLARIADERSAESLNILIAQLEARKTALHMAELDSSTKTAPPR